MKSRILIFALVIMGFVLMLTNSCKKEKEEVPVLATTIVTAITQTTAVSGANITSDGGAAVTARGVCWSTAATPTIADSKTSNGTGTGVFTSAITGLTPGATYYVRGYATNSAGTAYGTAKSFSALALLGPVVVTKAVTNVDQTTATSGGRITSDGGAAIIAKGVCWSTSATPTIADSKTTNGTDTASFVSNITGLTASTTYYVRAYATNSVATTYGTAVSFSTTAAPIVPTVTTTAITAITQTTASSGGSISADGGAAVTAKGLCWSTSATPTVADSKTLDGTGTASFTSSITGLAALTTYYVRAYATNSAGTGYGTAVSFTTSSNLIIPTLGATSVVTTITQTTAISGGSITSDGNAAITAKGVCWSLTSTPTIADSKTTDGTGTAAFVSAITGLTPGTTYYVRAYATNSVGTGYATAVSFTTTAPVVPLPVLTTTVVSAISKTTATSGGNITSEGGAAVTARGVCWGTGTAPTIADSKTTDASGTGVFVSALTGLTPGTTYYVRAYATNTGGTQYGAAESFTTLPLAVLPVITTTAVTAIASTTATSGGNVTSDGDATVTEKGVCWSTSATPSITDSKTLDGTGTGSFTSSITGLTASTTYYVSAYATNSVGTAYGTPVSFTTAAPPAVPVVTTKDVILIGHATAKSGGTVTSDGGGAITEKGVCWSVNPSPTITDSKTSDGTGNATFTSAITGLSASSAYYVRAYATNSTGTSYGAEKTFTTWGDPIVDNDGNEYHEVTIGSQIWLVEDLRTKHYLNGDPIPTVKLAADWNLLTTGAYVYYNNDSVVYKDYGLLYNGRTFLDPRGLGITGYHIPTVEECTTLQTFVGGATTGGGPLKAVSQIYWNAPNEGATNSTGFTALGTGRRKTDGSFGSRGSSGFFWTTTPYSTGGNYMALNSAAATFVVSWESYKYGLPIRLIKN